MKLIGSHRSGPRLERLKGLVLGLAAAGLFAGCSVAAASPSPTAGVPSPAASRSSTPTSSTTPSATSNSETTLTPTVTTTPGLIASLGTAPLVPWRGISWTSAGAVFPQKPVPAGTGSVEVSVFGWSRGYVGFRTAFDESTSTQPATFVTVSTSSTDGLHWTAGKPMDVKGLTDLIYVSRVIEGPSGLLAVGHYPLAACGGPANADAMWTSPDGLTWTRVQLPADFASFRVFSVDGGSAGFIAAGTSNDGSGQALWLSADGRSWHQTAVPTATPDTVLLQGATSFAGGYVVAGAVRGQAGCVGFNPLNPSLWWSAGGTGWTRVNLTGATPASNSTMAVTRISDHALMAIATEWNSPTAPTQTVWVSTDGRNWNVVKSPSSLLENGFITNGQRGLVVAMPSNNDGPPTIATVDNDLTVTTLTQTGNGPKASDTSVGWTTAVCPTGIVALSTDGLSLWVGVPTLH